MGELKLIVPPVSGAMANVPAPSGALHMVQSHLAEICSVAANVRVADYETVDPASVDGVMARSRALLASALEALDVVAVLYGQDELLEPAPASAPESDAGPESSARLDCEDIGETVVLARLGLRARQRALQSIGARATRMERLAVVGGTLRTIEKSLSAVDRAMATAEHVPQSIDFYGRAVQRSLSIRRTYVGFHQAIVKELAPQPEGLRLRLRFVGNSIAGLLGQSIALHLRTEDRALLMMAHGRIRDFLQAKDDDPQHASTGYRLWQDMVNLATMFLDVNKREELVQHDARLVHEVSRELAGGMEWSEAARAAVFERLSAMRGRSPVLDTLLDAGPAAAERETVRHTLEDLARSLGPVAGDGEEPAPSSGKRPVLRA